MKTKSQLIHSGSFQKALGIEMCECILFAHAMSGCDTVSSFFGIDKTKATKLSQNSENLRKVVQVFGDDHLSLDDIKNNGESFVLGVYGGKAETLYENHTLDHLNIPLLRECH